VRFGWSGFFESANGPVRGFLTLIMILLHVSYKFRHFATTAFVSSAAAAFETVVSHGEIDSTP
jgi:hypothetical protein